MYALMYSWRGLTRTPSLKVTFDYLLNPSGKSVLGGAGGVVDFLEAFAQRRGLLFSRVVATLAGFDTLPPDASAELRDWAATLIRAYNPDVSTLQDMISKTADYIDNGTMVVLVPHSQGNLFANSIARLQPLSSNLSAFGVVGVAVPDHAVENHKVPHVTLTEDLVIGAVRYLLDPLTLPANRSNGYPVIEWAERRFLSHSFTEAYLDIGKESERVIVSSIDDTFAVLQPTKSCIPPPISTAIRYLPSFFGGSTFTNKSCMLRPGVPSVVKIGADGTVSGTECYQAFTTPQNAPYRLQQNVGSTANTLSIFQPDRLNEASFLVINVRGAATSTISVAGSSFSSPYVSLQVDALDRIKTGLTAISHRKCAVGMTGAQAGDGYIEFDGTKVSLIQGGVTLGSALLSELGDVAFNESYGFSDTRDQWSISASRPATQVNGLSQVNLTVTHRDSPSLFQVSLSALKRNDGTFGSASCVATLP